MPDDFVREGEFDEFRRACDIRHREVDDMKKEVQGLRDCLVKKFNRHNYLLVAVLGGIIVDLGLRLLSMTAAKGGP